MRARRERGEWTVPTTMGLEKATNPFLRPSSVLLQRNLCLEGAPLVEVFTETRARKDRSKNMLLQRAFVSIVQ